MYLKTMITDKIITKIKLRQYKYNFYSWKILCIILSAIRKKFSFMISSHDNQLNSDFSNMYDKSINKLYQIRHMIHLLILVII